jgi:hypothetical protein
VASAQLDEPCLEIALLAQDKAEIAMGVAIVGLELDRLAAYRDEPPIRRGDFPRDTDENVLAGFGSQRNTPREYGKGISRQASRKALKSFRQAGSSGPSECFRPH